MNGVDRTLMWTFRFWGQWVGGCWWHLLRGLRACVRVKIPYFTLENRLGWLRAIQVQRWVLGSSPKENGLGWEAKEVTLRKWGFWGAWRTEEEAHGIPVFEEFMQIKKLWWRFFLAQKPVCTHQGQRDPQWVAPCPWQGCPQYEKKSAKVIKPSPPGDNSAISSSPQFSEDRI